MPIFAVTGLCAQAAVFRSGGTRKLALPEAGPDPTDTDASRAAFLARRRELSGERRLVLAVFMAALDDLHRYPRSARPYASAYGWVVSDDERWPLAFRSACATLELDPGAVRKHVLAVYRPPLPPEPRSVRPTRDIGVRHGHPPALVCGAA